LSLGILAALACTNPKGSLMLAISTDMQTPKDLSVVSVFIEAGGVAKFDYLGRVLPSGSVALPATLAVVEPDDDGEEIHIRVVGFQEQTARVVRDVLTTVPHGVTSLLRLPLSFLDDGSASGTLPETYLPDGPDGGGGPNAAPDGDTAFDPSAVASRCDWTHHQETSIHGVCSAAWLDPSTLQAYDPAQVYGPGGVQSNGAPVDCFDTSQCFAAATTVTGLDASSCSFSLPEGVPADLNLALVTPSTGACVTANQCYVPLDADAQDGWAVAGNSIRMLPGVCAKVQGNVTLAMSQGCAPKPVSSSVCEPGTGSVGFQPSDGGTADATMTTAGGDGGSPPGNDASAPPPNPHGTVVLPNGAQGVAIVHIEDATGALMAQPSVLNLPAMGDVVLVAEPPDLSQGIVATTQALQTLDNATTTPSITDDVPFSQFADGGTVGVPTTMTVFADSTFESVQLSDVYAPFFTCFTGGLHLAQNQTVTSSHATSTVALNASPDGTLIAETDVSGLDVVFENVVTMLSPHEIYYSGDFFEPVTTAGVVTGRGAMAYDPTTSDTMLYAGSDGTLYAFTSLKTTHAVQSVALPGAPAGASIAYAPTGQFAVVATSTGLFTVTVDAASGTPSVVGGPANPTYQGSDGMTYALSGAQSIAITSDGKYLVALIDQPSPTSGTLVALSIDASGSVGSIGMTKGGFLANPSADVLSAY
jgi:hypothetical protein